MEVNMPPAAVTLKGIFLAHLILTVWSYYSACLNTGSTLYNGAFLFLVLWSILHRDSEDAPLMALLLNLMAIFLDVMALVLGWPRISSSLVRFGLAMAVLNLILRPITSLMLQRVLHERSGSYGSYGPSGLDRIFGGTRRSPYEDIDQPTQTNQGGVGGVGGGGLDQEQHRAASPPSESLFTT
ncbi:type-1 angiotensin II receptor-associated protein-like [Eriocheir sinensis]|uniref:type-1 angiotensin II receptor-associated protein-like n=1 Tax=Eriocheir sinensis TaxID=95602 RepID=UPI0021C9E3CC|nr:type-1 angiotensin II receptor-associated protein-like [Eriocheir sinensis]